MTHFFLGILAGMITLLVVLFLGRHEPTAHGQSHIALAGIVLGIIVMALYWVCSVIWVVLL